MVIERDMETGELGIAVSSSFFAAGAHVPFVAPNIGAIAIQALVNPYHGIDGLQLLREGNAADQALDILLQGDTGREHRQAHVVDATGRVAAHTGASCLNWAGHRLGDAFSVAGNMLTGPQVLEQTSKGYLNNAHLPLAPRLIAAMNAVDTAVFGGVAKRSAALVIFANDEWSSLDIRVDDHPDPLWELERLEKVSREEWVRYRPFVPTRADPVGGDRS
jgi:uncharacterized Ntn-hydrolase superfamily protein